MYESYLMPMCTWTENSDVNDSFIPEILTIEECSKVSNTCQTQSINVNISGRKRSIKFLFSVQIMSYLGHQKGQWKKLANSAFKTILSVWSYLILMYMIFCRKITKSYSVVWCSTKLTISSELKEQVFICPHRWKSRKNISTSFHLFQHNKSTSYV